MGSMSRSPRILLPPAHSTGNPSGPADAGYDDGSGQAWSWTRPPEILVPGLAGGLRPDPAGHVSRGPAEWQPLPADLPAAELHARFREALATGLRGLCFSPYLDRQGPGTAISPEQIQSRLTLLRPYTRWVRTFSCTDGHQHAPAIAHGMGLQTLVGAWLGTDPTINRKEIEGLITVGRAGHADVLAVGNEVLLREDLAEDALLAAIEEVRAAVPGVPVGYVDAYYLFEQHPRVTAACDVLLANCYPFWEGCPLEHALPYLQDMVRRVQAVAGPRQVVISETGWPDQGSPFHGATPSRENTMRYFVDTLAWSRSAGVDVFWFSAFDEAWKVGIEGDVGACWGLWDRDGRMKFP